MNLPTLKQAVAEALEVRLRDMGIAALMKAPRVSGIADMEVILSSGHHLFLDYLPNLSTDQLVGAARRLRASLPAEALAGVVVRRLGPSLLDACKAEKVCAFGLDGNAYVRAPGVYVERLLPAQPLKRMPSAGTCFTAKASRLTRALLALYPEAHTQAALSKETGLSRGYVSILTSRLVEDRQVSIRSDRLHLEDPDRLLDAWAAHYRMDRHRQFHFATVTNGYEQGIGKLARALEASGVGFAFTGWTGGYLLTPHATPELLTAYVERIPEPLAGIHPVERRGNVLLLVPQDAGVFQFTTLSPFGPVVSDAQVYLDLLGMQGRAKEQADMLRRERLNFGGRTP